MFSAPELERWAATVDGGWPLLVIVVLMLTEFVINALAGKRPYSLKETLANAGVALTTQLGNIANIAVSFLRAGRCDSVLVDNSVSRSSWLRH